MKILSALALGLVSMAASLYLLFPSPLFSPEEGLVAYYSFDQCDARDDSGNGSDGRLFGNSQCYCGVENEGIRFDGRTTYAEFYGQVNKYFTTSDFTISFYFRPMHYSVFNQSLLGKRESCDEYHMFDIQYNAARREVVTPVHETPEKYYPDLSPRADSTIWVHFALVREGNRAFTYINGTLRRSGLRCSGVDLANETVLAFSHSPCLRHGRTKPFEGVLDELRIYDHALSEREMAALYSLHPVESAEIDCLAALPENPATPYFLPAKALTFARHLNDYRSLTR